jgi:hypothetical protein
MVRVEYQQFRLLQPLQILVLAVAVQMLHLLLATAALAS